MRCLNLSIELLEVKETIQTLTTCYDAELVVLKQVMACKIFQVQGTLAKARIINPKAFIGNRNAKDLENFLWDMEQYFKVAKIANEDKVRIIIRLEM